MMKMTICGKSYEEYLAEKKKKNGTLRIKRGVQRFLDGEKTVFETSYTNSVLVPGDGHTKIQNAVAVLEKNGQIIPLRGTIEFKNGKWYENGNEVKI